jgi:hypothetical protein
VLHAVSDPKVAASNKIANAGIKIDLNMLISPNK